MLKGLGNLANLPQMLKQAQEIGGKMQAMQEQLKAERVTGAAGGGMIEVDANGLGEVLAVRIEQTLIDKADKEMLEDLLPAAMNDAAAKAKQKGAEAMQEATGGLNLPGMDQLMGGAGS